MWRGVIVGAFRANKHVGVEEAGRLRGLTKDFEFYLNNVIEHKVKKFKSPIDIV
jgi:hypothetical protein